MNKLRDLLRIDANNMFLENIEYIESCGGEIEEKVIELFSGIIPTETVIPYKLIAACEKILGAAVNTLKVIRGEVNQPEDFAIKITTFPNRRNFLGGFAVHNERSSLNNYPSAEIYLVSFTDYYNWVEERNFDFKQLVMCIAPPAYEIITGVLNDSDYQPDYYKLDSRSCAIMNYSGEYGYKLAKGQIDKKKNEIRKQGWLSNSIARLISAGFSNALGWNFNYFRNEQSGSGEYERKLEAGMQLEMSIYAVENLKKDIVFKGYKGKDDIIKGEHKTLLERMLEENQTDISKEIVLQFEIDPTDLWGAIIDNMHIDKTVNWKCIIEAGLLHVMTYTIKVDNEYTEVVKATNSYLFNATRNGLLFDSMKTFDEDVSNWNRQQTEMSRDIAEINMISMRDVINEIGHKYMDGNSLFIADYIVEACVLQYAINHNLDNRLAYCASSDYAEIAINKRFYFKDMLAYTKEVRKDLLKHRLSNLKLSLLGKCYKDIKDDCILKIVNYKVEDDIDLFCSTVILSLKVSIPEEYIKPSVVDTLETYLKSI